MSNTIAIIVVSIFFLASLVGTVLPILSSDVVLIKPSDPVWVLPLVSGVHCLLNWS